MKGFVVAIVIGLTAVAMGEGTVMKITDKNYEELIKERTVLINFFDPSTEQCKALAPEYEKLAQKVMEMMTDWIIGEVNANEEKSIIEKNSIQGYPTIKLFIKGSSIIYDGELKAEDILEFIQIKGKSSITVLKTSEEVQAVQEHSDEKRVILISDNEEVKTLYSAVAQSDDDFKFYTLNEEEGIKAFPSLASFPAVMLFKNYDEKEASLVGSLTKENLEEFLKSHRYPKLTDLDKNTANPLFQSPTHKGIIYIHKGYDDQSKKSEEILREFAAKNPSKDILFVSADTNSEWGSPIMRFFALQESDLPLIEAADMLSGELKRYKFSEEITLSNLNKFLSDYKENKLKRFLKSEDIPENNEGPVIKLVGKNFQSLVIDNDNDVLVKFYAPWCGHCKQLAPVFEGVATEMAKTNPKIILAEMDSTKNDVEGIRIRGYPTLKFYPGNRKNDPMDYNKGRSADDIKNFLKENAVNYQKQDL